jgi:hypothetical protein
MLTILLVILLIVVAGWAAFWFIAQSGMPAPAQMIARVIVAILGLIALFSAISGYIPNELL